MKLGAIVRLAESVMCMTRRRVSTRLSIVAFVSMSRPQEINRVIAVCRHVVPRLAKIGRSAAGPRHACESSMHRVCAQRICMKCRKSESRIILDGLKISYLPAGSQRTWNGWPRRGRYDVACDTMARDQLRAFLGANDGAKSLYRRANRNIVAPITKAVQAKNNVPTVLMPPTLLPYLYSIHPISKLLCLLPSHQ